MLTPLRPRLVVPMVASVNATRRPSVVRATHEPLQQAARANNLQEAARTVVQLVSKRAGKSQPSLMAALEILATWRRRAHQQARVAAQMGVDAPLANDFARAARDALGEKAMHAALRRAYAALDPATPGDDFSRDIHDTLTDLAIEGRHWPLLERLLNHASTDATDLRPWARKAVDHGAPAPLVDRLLGTLEVPGGFQRQHAVELVRLYKDHASAETLTRMRATHGFIPTVAASWRAGRLNEDDVSFLLRALAMGVWQDILPATSAMARTLDGNEAAMLPTWRAMVQAYEQNVLGHFDVAEMVRAWEQHADPVASAPAVRRSIIDPQRAMQLVQQAMAGHGGIDAHKQLLRHAVSQWLTGDRAGVRASLQHLHIDDERVLVGILDGCPHVVAAMAQWLVQQRDWPAVTKLLPAVPREAAVPLLHNLQRCDAPLNIPMMPLFGPEKLSISEVPADLQAWVAPRVGTSILTWVVAWDANPHLAFAFARVGNADAEDRPRLLAAWRLCIRIPAFAQLFRSTELRSPIVKELVQDPTLTDRGLLLALAVVSTGAWKLLYEANIVQLIHDKHVVKSDPRLRRALDTFVAISEMHRCDHELIETLAAWPTAPQLRELLLAAAHTHLEACAQALYANAKDLHQHQANLVDAINLATLHARHTHQSGDQEAITQHRAALTTLLAAVHKQRATPAGSDTQWARHLAILTKAETPLTQQLRALDKPTTPQDVPNFFTMVHHRAALNTLQHTLSSQRLDALAMLSHMEALGVRPKGSTPQAVQQQLEAALQLEPARQKNFAALQQSFRQPRLLWALSKRARESGPAFVYAFDAILKARLDGDAAYHLARATAPQMQHLFASGERAALQQAWEAGAQAPCTDPALKSLTLADTGDFADFASSGDEISGSCHSLMGGGFGEHLLGRMLDGSKRMVVLKDASGALQARAMLRLMHNTRTQEPVLLLSTLYAGNVDQAAAKQALVAFARDRAKALGLSLVCMTELNKSVAHELTTQQVYRDAVECLCGPLGEYWDEYAGTRGAGAHRISNLHVL